MTFHLELLLFLNISSTLVFVMQNPVSSALWLIVTFFCSSIIIWLLNSEFFALIYVIIYVGAIAVLFLFVIMMLDIKIISTSLSFENFFFHKKIFNIFIYLVPATFLSYFLSFNLFLENKIYTDNFYLTNFDNLSNIHAFGQILYNYYLSCIIIAGLILLVAILGAITLTLNFNTINILKFSSKQISRSENFLVFFK